jgi:hypothetical protein
MGTQVNWQIRESGNRMVTMVNAINKGDVFKFALDRARHPRMAVSESKR